MASSPYFRRPTSTGTIDGPTIALEGPLNYLAARHIGLILHVCVWSAVGNGSIPVGPVVRLVHPIRAPLPPQTGLKAPRGCGEARCPTIAGSDYPW